MALEWITWEIWLIFLLILLGAFLIIVFFQLNRIVKSIPKDVIDNFDRDSELTRDLTFKDVTLLGVGAMIGAGIFVLTGDAAGFAGPGLIAVFLFNGFATGLTALIYAELGSAVPEAGGGYLWVKSAMGQYQAFLGGWMSWLAHIVAGSLYGIGFGSYFAFLLGKLGILSSEAYETVFWNTTLNINLTPTREVTIIDADFGYTQIFSFFIILLFLFINYLGSSETGAVGNIITVTKVIIITIFILSGLYYAVMSGFVQNFGKLEPVFPESRIEAVGEDFPPFIRGAFLPIFIAMGFTFISFEGYEIIVQTGEEVQEPNISIPKAIFGSLLIVVPIYFFVGLASLVAIQPDNPDTPTWKILGNLGEIGVAEIAEGFMPLGSTLMLFGGLVSTLSALNATIYSSARVSFVMGRDGLLPKRFHDVNAWRRTPHFAIIISGIIMVLIAVFLPLEEVAAMADLLFVLLFLQVNISIFKIREKYEGKLFYGYKVPLFPILPILAIIAQIGLGIALTLHFRIAPAGAFIWLLIGTIFYFGYVKPRLKVDIVDAFADYIRPKAKESSIESSNQLNEENGGGN